MITGKWFSNSIIPSTFTTWPTTMKKGSFTSLLPLFSYLFIISMYLWIFTLFHYLQTTTIITLMLKLLSIWPSWVLLTSPSFFNDLLTFYISCILSALVLNLPFPPRNLSFFKWGMVFKNENMSCWYTHCHWTHSRPLKQTDIVKYLGEIIWYLGFASE